MESLTAVLTATTATTKKAKSSLQPYTNGEDEENTVKFEWDDGMSVISNKNTDENTDYS